MAGGSGERFWPLSRKHTPKQLIKLGDNDKTMLREAIERIAPLIPVEDIFIITGEHLLAPIRKELPELPPENVIAEPAKRNTAPCLALGAAFIKAKYNDIRPSEIGIAVLTADHIIKPAEKFIETVSEALKHIENHNALTTVGIPPTRAETGYGYIELPGIASDWTDGSAKEVLSFREKPNADKAAEYCKAGNFLWNSGMFFWRLDVFTDALIKALPEVGGKIVDMADKYIGNTATAFEKSFAGVEDIFKAFPSISIDYGLMEKADNTACVKSRFEWDDCGSFDAMERITGKDSEGNISRGKNILLESKDNIIINSTDKDMILTGYGLEGLVVTVTDDALMICPKDKVQNVKKIVEELKKNPDDAKKYL